MDHVAQALSDPIRREILRLLRDRAVSAGEVAAQFAVSRPAVSRHLRVLREADLVRHTVCGRERQYYAHLAPLAELRRYLDELDAAPSSWLQRFDALATEVQRTVRRRRSTEAEHAKKQRRSTA